MTAIGLSNNRLWAAISIPPVRSRPHERQEHGILVNDLASETWIAGGTIPDQVLDIMASDDGAWIAVSSSDEPMIHIRVEE